MVKRKLLAQLALVGLLLALPWVLLADAPPQNDPTLRETESWLKLHLPTSFVRSDTFETVLQSARFSFRPKPVKNTIYLPLPSQLKSQGGRRACALSVSIRTDYTLHEYNSNPEPIFVVNMQSADDTTVFGEDGHGLVPLGELNLASIKVKMEESEASPLSLSYHDFQVAFRHEDKAQRVAKAFRHAAELCGAT